MLNGFCNVSIDRDLTDDVLKSLNDLAKKTVCIGVPDSTEHSERGDVRYNATHEKKIQEGSNNRTNTKITNAELMYVHTNGARNKDMIQAMQHDIDSGMPYSQAHELYVHEHGSPLWNIPPRPILEPAIENGKEQITELLKDAALQALDGNNIQPSLEKVGMQGQNIARGWFTNPSNNWAANSKETIKKKGSSRPLIDTGELRKSITYVIKDGE